MCLMFEVSHTVFWSSSGHVHSVSRTEGKVRIKSAYLFSHVTIKVFYMLGLNVLS